MKTFALYNALGQPIAGNAPTFAYFGDRSGNPVAPPAITDSGNGNYQFEDLPFVAEYVYLIQANGDTFPKYLFGSISDPLLPFGVLFFTNPDGSLWTSGGSPQFQNYKTFIGTSPSTPTINRVSNSGVARALYTFTPGTPELTLGVQYIVQAPPGAIPEYYDGNLEPETGGGGTGPTPTIIRLTGFSVFSDHIILTFDKPVVLNPPSDLFSNWTISGGSTPMTISAVTVLGPNQVRLDTNTITDGEARILSIPNGIESNIGEVFAGPYLVPFNAVYLSPVVHLVSGAVFADHINLVFDKNIVLTSLAAVASNWTITNNPGDTPLTIGSVQVTGNTVRLNINEATDGGAYVVHLPTAGIQSTLGDLYFGPFVYNFNAVGVAPYIANAISLDSFKVRIYYSEPVVQSDALNIANYSSSPSLTIYSVTPETASIYVLTTSVQAVGQNYTLTVTNVRDLQNNPV